MLKGEQRRKEITARLSILTYYIKLCNKQGLTDANKEAEDFFCGLLNIVLGTSLENLNYIQRDYAAIDLGDREEALAIQVTSTNSREKIEHTLAEFFKHEQDQIYNQLIVLIIGDKVKYRKKFQTKRRFRFDPEQDVWDTATLCEEIMRLDDDKQDEVIRYLDAKMVIPKTAAAQTAEAPEAPPVSGDKKLKYLLPTTLGVDGFMGRTEELEKLDQALERREKPIFITGLGGMGKTELAIRFCQAQTDFRTHFVRFAGTFKDTVTQNLAQGVENLWLSESRPRDQIYREVMAVLKECGSDTILIIDNADPADGNFDSLKDETFRELCSMNLRLIITTRANVRGGVAVGPMEPAQLLDIMGKYVCYPDDKLLPLIEAVNRHTLTVDLMARTLDESCDDVTPAMLLEALRSSTLPEEDYPEITTDHNRDEKQLQIYAHLRSLFNVVQLDGDSRTALGCATLLPEGGMATPLFRNSLPAGAREAFKSLEKRGFLRREAGIVTIHPVIRLVARHELKPTDESCRAFLETLWSNYDKKQYDHDKYTCMAELYTLAAEKLENSLGGWSGRARALWTKVRQDANAMACAKLTIQRREASLPADHPDLADAYNDMGIACQDPWMEAEYFEKALAIRQRIFTGDHVDLARSYNNVGAAWEMQGDYQQALDYKRRAMEMLQRILPADDPDLAASYHHVGTVYLSLGNYTQALEYFEKSLAILEQVLPQVHPDVARSLASIGNCHHSLGDYRKALEYLKKALAILEQVLPQVHPDVAHSLAGIGSCCYQLDDYSTALDYQLKALMIREKALPRLHLDVAHSLAETGSCHASLGDSRKALEYHKKALAVREQVLPPDHPDVAHSLSQIGNCHHNLGDSRKALEYHQKALAIREKTLPPDHPDLAWSYKCMGYFHGEGRQYSQAVAYLEKALLIFEAKLPPGYEDTENTRLLLNHYRRKLQNLRPDWMDQIN